MIAPRADQQLRDRVIEALKWDSRVDDTKIGVTVESHVVTLRGTVHTYAEKLAAEELAHAVPGVLDVANDVIVEAPFHLGRSDTELALAVRHALEWDVFVPDERIRSTVHDGWITLEGEVDLLREREDADRAVRRLAGVIGLHNHIVIAPHAAKPEAVRSAIQQALERHAEHEAKHIDVRVTEGVVTLEGSVGSFAEKRAVLGMVSHLRGVRSIDDRLTLRS
jgi:hyperosmotically inducible protein